MTTTYFYMYPMEKISEIFPGVGDGTRSAGYDTCNVHGGWTHEMMEYADTIFEVKKFILKDKAVLSKGSEWVFDTRLGRILIVDEEIKYGYHFLDYTEEEGYKVTIRPSKNTIGTIVNFPHVEHVSSVHPVFKNLREQRKTEKIKNG